MRGLSVVVALVLVGCTSGGGADGKDVVMVDGVPVDTDDTDPGPTWPTSADCTAPDPNERVRYSVEPGQMDFEGFDVRLYIPDNPVGLVWYFHGSGGDAAQLGWTEVTALLDLMVQNGVGIVATESTDRSGAQWDTDRDFGSNADLPRLDRLRDELIATTALQESTPIVAIGFSNGGAMAGVVASAAGAAGWPIVAASSHNSGLGNVQLDVPVLVSITENDDPATNNAGRDDYQDHQGRVPAQLHETLEIPLHPDRFARIGGGYDVETSNGVFDELVSFDMIDTDGTRIVPIDDVEGAFSYYENNALVGFGPPKVTAQLRVVWQMHRFNAQMNGEECSFLMSAIHGEL
jgi:predicted esterase